MHIQFDTQDATGRTRLRAVREADDRALPVDQLIFDTAPGALTDDRIAIAGALAFGSYAADEIAFPSVISAAAADAIRSTTGLRISSDVARMSGDGGDDGPLQATLLTVTIGSSLPISTPSVDHARLNLIEDSRYNGALYGVKEAVIASNVWYAVQRLDAASVLAAAGVLFAQDLLARELCLEIPSGAADGLSDRDRTLCAAIGLELS